MGVLAAKRMDTIEAAADIASTILAEIPTATNISTTIEGEVTPRTFGQAYRADLKSVLQMRAEAVFSVIADARTPRSIRIRCEYLAVGRDAMVGSIFFLTRLRRVVPGAALYTPARIRGSSLEADPSLRDRLNAVLRLGKSIGSFFRPAVMLGGGGAVTYKPYLQLIPDKDGAIVAALTTPKGRLGLFGSRSLDLVSFLDIVDGLDVAVTTMPGSAPAPVPTVELPA